MVSPRDLRGVVRIAAIDGVMLSEHIVLGPSAGNQDPAPPWPSSLILMGAIAQATSVLRLVAAPLRHPLTLAKELATLDLLAPRRVRRTRRAVRRARADPRRAARRAPGPRRPALRSGPPLWFGGQGMHPPLLRRPVRHGQAGAVGPRRRRRAPDALELVGGIRGTFRGAGDTADLDRALEALPACFKPSMFIDDAAKLGPFCRSLIRKIEEASP